MGSVYLALDLKLDIKVALKIPRPEIFAVPRLRERFYREARAAARLVHPGLCWVMDVGQVEDTHYLVMRYVPGTPLSRYPSLTPVEAATMTRDIALAMAAAHREGVVHRDLKPSNIIVTTEGNLVVVDFGLALLIDDDLTRLTEPGERLGTPHFMPPEQLLGQPEAIGPRSDIYSLGCVLYKLLSGQHPFEGSIEWLLSGPPAGLPLPPSVQQPDIDPALDSICLKAIARGAEDRYQSMAEFAACLDAFIEEHLARSTVPVPRQTPSAVGQGICSCVHREAIRFVFTAPGSSAPKAGMAPDRLFLGVGNDLRVGVIDPHNLHSYSGSTARLVVSNSRLVTEAATAHRDPRKAFTIVLPEAPGFDGVAAAYLAVGLLTTGELPPGAEALARYADKINEGSIGHSLSHPFSPYAAYMQLLHREARRARLTDHELWLECVQQGLVMISHSLDHALRDGVALPSVNAFACADMFSEMDRRDVLADIEKYHRKLADPATRARVARLSLPGQFGGRVDVDALLARDVQNADDPDRCIFFKDWARSDRDRSPGGEGFQALSVFVSESRHEVRHCVLSVTPDSGASLRGLASLLDRVESGQRCRVFGEDDRVIDPATGSRMPPRAGYDNADPWYDGRAHGFTIVDSPRAGTLLAAEVIEGIFEKFGGLS
jgi:serine/threonine protein kinase